MINEYCCFIVTFLFFFEFFCGKNFIFSDKSYTFAQN